MSNTAQAFAVQPDLVTEAESQRQHPRYKLPLQARIGDRRYIAADWSVGGLALLNTGSDFSVGQEVQIMLVLPLRGFSVTSQIKGVVRYTRQDLGRTGFEFTDVTLEQTALLRFVIDNYLSGNLADVDSVVEFLHRDHGTKRRAEPKVAATARRGRDIFQRLIGFVLALSICAVAIYFLGTSLYDRLFVVNAPAAAVGADLIAAEAVEDGTVLTLTQGREVKPGDVLATFERQDGATAQITSPCDCVVVSRVARPGRYVRRGEAVLQLIEKGADPYVLATVPFAKLDELSGEVAVEIEYLSGETSRIILDDLLRRRSVDPDSVGQTAKLSLPTGQPLRVEDIGQPVRVRFDTFVAPWDRFENRFDLGGRSATPPADGTGR